MILAQLGLLLGWRSGRLDRHSCFIVTLSYPQPQLMTKGPLRRIYRKRIHGGKRGQYDMPLYIFQALLETVVIFLSGYCPGIIGQEFLVQNCLMGIWHQKPTETWAIPLKNSAEYGLPACRRPNGSDARCLAKDRLLQALAWNKSSVFKALSRQRPVAVAASGLECITSNSLTKTIRTLSHSNIFTESLSNTEKQHFFLPPFPTVKVP